MKLYSKEKTRLSQCYRSINCTKRLLDAIVIKNICKYISKWFNLKIYNQFLFLWRCS